MKDAMEGARNGRKVVEETIPILHQLSDVRPGMCFDISISACRQHHDLQHRLHLNLPESDMSSSTSPDETPELGRLGVERNLGAGVSQEVLEASLCYRKAYKPGSASHARERGVGARWHESKAGRIFLPIAAWPCRSIPAVD
jgi:hypothetical protein